MQFNSTVFFLFLIVFFSFWPLAKRRNIPRWIYLIAFSFVYYGWNNWRYLFLMPSIGLLDYIVARMMAARPRKRKLYVSVAVGGNLLLLIYFKYSLFLVRGFQSLLLAGGIHVRLVDASLSLAVPLGISFYTFQSLTYVIEVYRNRIEPVKNPLHLMAFLSLFPLMLSGPIARAKEILPQLLRTNDVPEERRWEGLKLIIGGFFKKIVIADNLAPAVAAAFDSGKFVDSSPYWWLIMTLFAWQIYCDFSGYTDIARGLGKWLGLEFPENFNLPYFANSCREFWNRWHMTLSTWLRDYLFLPLSYLVLRKIKADRFFFMKTENFAYYLALFITMLVCGLWHGAGPTFLVWGGLHALFISIERLSRWPKRLKKKRVLGYLVFPLFISQIWIAWVFFRSASLEQAGRIISSMFSFTNGVDVKPMGDALIYLGIIVLYELYRALGLSRRTILPPRWHRRWEIVAAAIMIVACVFLRGKPLAFVYFKF